MVGRGKWCCLFCSWHNVGTSKHCGNCGRSSRSRSRGSTKGTEKWTCHRAHESAKARVQNLRRAKKGTDKPPRHKPQERGKAVAEQTRKPNKKHNQRTVNLIEAESNKIQSLRSNRRDMWRYESLHERTGRPVVMGQSGSSFVLSVIKTEVPLDCDDSAYQNFPLQQHGERIEKLSPQNKLSKFCMDAGFLSVVENGQYFITKDSGDLTQFHAVTCREYTLPREEPESQPKGWIQGNTKIGPVLEVATSYLHGKNGVGIRILSLNKDNTHSWVRISHGSNKFVMNLSNNETDIPENQLEEYALKLDAKDFPCRTKAKAKPQRRELVGFSPRIVPIGWRNWIDIEPGKYSFSDYDVSKKRTFFSSFTTRAPRKRWSSSYLEN